MRALMILILVFNWAYAQTINLIPIGSQSVSGIPITVEHYVTTSTGSLDVKIYKTHYGNGNTSTYQSFAYNATDLDKMTNSTYPGTTLHWQGNLSALAVLNFNQGGTLVNAGASVPNNYDFYSVEANCTFVPKETGNYNFRITSDDASDLFINGVNIVNYYGGHGMNPFYYVNYYMTAGMQYSFRARMQEYGGGDGLVVQWRRPSQTGWNVQLDEIGISSTSWVPQGTKFTDVNGTVTFSNNNNYPYRAKVDLTGNLNSLNLNSLLYLQERIMLGDYNTWDVYTCDINQDGDFGYADMVEFYMNYIMLNRFRTFVFSFYEKVSIENSPGTNFYSIYPGQQERTFVNEDKLYIVGIGKHKKSTLINEMQ